MVTAHRQDHIDNIEGVERILLPQYVKEDKMVYALRYQYFLDHNKYPKEQQRVYYSEDDKPQDVLDFEDYPSLSCLSQNVDHFKKKFLSLPEVFAEYIRLVQIMSEGETRQFNEDEENRRTHMCHYRACSSKEVAIKTRRGCANWIVANSDIIEKTVEFDEWHTDPYGFRYAKTSERFHTVVDYDIGPNKVLIGFTGNRSNDLGIVIGKEEDGNYTLVPSFPKTSDYYYIIELENYK